MMKHMGSMKAELAVYLATELTKILAVLTDLHLLNLLPQTSPITGTCKVIQRHVLDVE